MSSIVASAMRDLRAMMMNWALAGLLPLPILVAMDPAHCAEMACLYVGLASAWLATEIDRVGEAPHSPAARRAKFLAILIAVATNVAVFVAFGLAVGVRTYFPFPLMAVLSAIPAIGLVPWLSRRMRDRHAAILVACFVVGGCKLAGCFVARIVYGPNYIAMGYVADDWRTAKLMISLLWIFSTSISLTLLFLDCRTARSASDAVN